jgi:hypothetical protein
MICKHRKSTAGGGRSTSTPGRTPNGRLKESSMSDEIESPKLRVVVTPGHSPDGAAALLGIAEAVIDLGASEPGPEVGK